MNLINNIFKNRFTKSLSIKERYKFTNNREFRNKRIYALDKITISLYHFTPPSNSKFISIFQIKRIFDDIKVEYIKK